MAATRTRKPKTVGPAAPPRRTPWAVIDDKGLTAGNRLCELLRIGTHLDHAAAGVGVTVSEVRRWMRDGLAALARYDAGTPWSTFTLDEQRLATFAHDAVVAEGEWIARGNAALEELARGKTITKTTRTLTNGVEVERRVTVEEGRPDARVLMWRMERRYPNLYGQRSTVTLLTDDTADDDDAVARLRDRLQQVAERLPSPAIEATVSDG